LSDAGRFTVPPRNQGQIVLVGYGCSADYIYERSLDQSDLTVSITAYSHPMDADEYSFQPHNSVPDLGRRVGTIYRGPIPGEPGQTED